LIKRIFLAVLFIALCFSQSILADTEFWSVNIIQSSLSEKVKLNIIPELRFRNNASELYYFQTYIGPALLLSKNFEMDIYYALNCSKNGDNWTGKSLGYLDAIYKVDSPWFSFADRGRFEYDVSPAVLKLRNLFQFKKNAWILSDELFYNVNQGYFDEGRSMVAYSTRIFGNTELLIGYLLRRQRASATADWQKTNVINLCLKVDW